MRTATVSTRVAPFAFATVVTAKAIENLLENTGEGGYRDSHPWIVAKELLAEAKSRDEIVPLLLAVPDESNELSLSHWAPIVEIEALELHRGQWDSICRFGALKEVNPIWQSLDSVALSPTAEQLRREHKEQLQVHRYHLDATVIRPYAICETPPFLLYGDAAS